MKRRPIVIGLLFLSATVAVTAAALLAGGRAGRGSKAGAACPQLAELQKMAGQLDGSGRVTLRIEIKYPELLPPWRLLMTVRGMSDFTHFDTDDGTEDPPLAAEVANKISSIAVLTGIDTVDQECRDGTSRIERDGDVFVVRSTSHLDGRYTFVES